MLYVYTSKRVVYVYTFSYLCNRKIRKVLTINPKTRKGKEKT